MTTETIKVMLARYACRAYTDKMPSDEALHAIAEAAIAAPSGYNRQHWRVIAVKNKQLIADLENEGMKQLAAAADKNMYNRIASRGGKLFYNAPCMMVVSIKPAEPAGAEQVDLGTIAENIALAAASLGIDNVICGMFRLCFAGSRAEEFKQRLGFPEGFESGLAVLLGYAEKQGHPHELDYSKISFVE